MRKLTTEEFIEKAKAVHGDKYDYSKVVYKTTREEVLIICPTHGAFWKSPNKHISQKQGCPECSKSERTLSHEEHAADIMRVNPNIEVLGEIINNRTKVLCCCKICGYKWVATPHYLKEGHSCRGCAKVKSGAKKINQRRAAIKKLTHAEQIAAINKVNPNVEVLGEITGNDKKVLCRCKICSHKWYVSPCSLKRGYGCPGCWRIKNRKSHEVHLKEIEAVNKNVEVLEKIKNNHTKVLCRCNVCGYRWGATPNNLKRGYGCPSCAGNRKLAQKEWEKAVHAINPNIKILEKIENARSPILCRCKVCSHEWKATPSNLKLGTGCPRCAKHGFLGHSTGKLYIMVDDLNVPTMMKIGVSVREDERSKRVVGDARRAGVIIPALHVAKTWEGPTEAMYALEQAMHKSLSQYKINFPMKFDGCQEFFYYRPEVFELIEEHLKKLSGQ